jgi:uncharacterized membrane protein
MTAITVKRGLTDSTSWAGDDGVRLFALVSLTGIALGLWASRAHFVGPRFSFLWWNLFLAWVPWLVSVTMRHAKRGWLFWPLAATWLAFFPNAPYLLTDLVHLKARPPIPLWFDVLFLATFAWAGCLVGWDSLWRVHRELTARLGARAAALLVTASVLLCGVGVFLGRFERLNSWELVTDPVQVALTASEALLEPKALLFSLAFAGFVGAGYLFVRPWTHESQPADCRAGS